MKERILKKWVRALRGGRYKKTDGVLMDDVIGAHCVLGVLCDLHSKETGTEGWSGHTYLGNGSELPGAVMEWAGLNENDPYLTEDNDSATELNDGRGSRKPLSFKQLADLFIKAQEDGLLGEIIKEKRKAKKKAKKTIVEPLKKSPPIGTGLVGEIASGDDEEATGIFA